MPWLSCVTTTPLALPLKRHRRRLYQGVALLCPLHLLRTFLRLLLLSRSSSSSTATGMPSESMRSLMEGEIRFYSALSYHLTRSRDFLESEEYLDELKKKIDNSPFGIDAVSQSTYHR
ncbi:hypothetical protein CSUI_007816, partial [Cystoisospora suis]